MSRRAREARVVALAFALGLGLATASCSRPSTTGELKSAIDAYAQGVPEATAEKIDALFAELDAEVADLRAKAAQKQGEARAAAEQDADALARQRRELHGEYVKGRFARVGDAAGKALQSAGEAIGQGLEDLGRELRKSAQGADEPADAASRTPTDAPIQDPK